MARKKPKPNQREPEPRGRMSEEEVIEIAETRGNHPELTAGDMAHSYGVSLATIYKYSPRVIVHATPWERREILEAAEAAGISTSMYLFLLHQEYGKTLQNKIKKGGLRAVG